VNGLIVSGSIAHGCCRPESDVDVMILVGDAEHEERLRSQRTCFFSTELCTYPGGYVDGKYVSEAFLREVAARGSEPARYAFQDARVIFSKSAALEPLLRAVVRYPLEQKAERIQRFQAQFEAWRWYAGEALARQNAYLLGFAVAKLVLFGGRVVLAHNELLYPYHKWFLRVLAAAPEKPEGIVPAMLELSARPTRAGVDAFVEMIRAFRAWEVDAAGWGAAFMRESELNWLAHSPPVDDI
jgi:hypothetical protein